MNSVVRQRGWRTEQHAPLLLHTAPRDRAGGSGALLVASLMSRPTDHGGGLGLMVAWASPLTASSRIRLRNAAEITTPGKRPTEHAFGCVWTIPTAPPFSRRSSRWLSLHAPEDGRPGARAGLAGLYAGGDGSDLDLLLLRRPERIEPKKLADSISASGQYLPDCLPGGLGRYLNRHLRTIGLMAQA